MDTSTEIKAGKRFSIILLLAALISFVFYVLTCFRTFTWWDSSEYSLAALTLGVPHPPGSLLTVILGWIVTRLPLGLDKFFLLNLLAALVAAVTVYAVGLLALRLYRQTNGESSEHSYAPKLGAFLGALTFGISITTWYYAIRFTPYITTALLTTFIIAAMLAWQRRSLEPNSHLWLGLVTLLFGLDFSVHRTNLLMLPALLIWVAIFHPRAYLSAKSWLSGIIGLLVGLAVQLFLIPIAALQPFINFNNPSSLARFWDYITLKQYGGGWLINIIPRKATFLSVQIADYIKIFRDNFANDNLAYMGFLPLVVGLVGLVILFKRNWKLGLGLIVLFLFSSLGAIIYFNLPMDFFRSIDRHYMPSFVIFAIFIAYGAVALWQFAFSIKNKARYMAYVVLVLSILMPLQGLRGNYRKVDGSKSYFAYDTAKNYLAYLPQGAIFFAQADIDTYTLWCLQAAEKLRPNITVCNMSLMNTPWFIEQVQNHDNKFPIKLDKKELSSLSVIPWHDTTFSLPVLVNTSAQNLSLDSRPPDSITVTVAPSMQSQYLFVQDQMLLKIIGANNWQRPICFSSLMSEASIQWLKPYLRLEGLYKRLVPSVSGAQERDLLGKNLLDNYNYRGYLDPSISKDEPTKWIGWNYCSSFLGLSYMYYGSGDTLGCRNVMAQMQKAIAIDQLSPPPELKNALVNACK